MSLKNHWEAVYTSKSAQVVSWYQPHAMKSLDIIRASGGDLISRIIDIGGGASTLVDDLQALGYKNLSVLDISKESLEVSRKRLGSRAHLIKWIEGDITKVSLPKLGYDIWHDRAVFHFLTEKETRNAYISQVKKALKPCGHLIIATFASDGPLQCSGLPVMRYSPESLRAEFFPGFELINHVEENHITPNGSVQQFIYCHFIKST
jgi:SAM-dependent methyltransferase